MKGTVKALSQKDFNGKTMYSFKVDDDWYGCGPENPKLDKGDLIEFDFTENGRWKNVQVKTISVLRKGSEVFKASTRKVSVGGARDEYWVKKEERDVITQKVIQLQSSRNSAIALADVLLKNNAIKLPEAQAKRMDVVVALVKDLTGAFEAESLAHRGMEEKIEEEAAAAADPETTDGGDDIWGE